MTTDKKKTRWVVLGPRTRHLFGQEGRDGRKPPKLTVDVRRDVARVVCNSMQNYSILLSADVVDGKAKEKKVAYKAGEPRLLERRLQGAPPGSMT